jgi:transcriptional repressor NrdR
MKCPFCGGFDDKVADSRAADDGLSIKRRRECNACGKRFTTFEKVDAVSIVVVKRDMSRQTFDAGKLLKGVMRACEKRPVSMAQMQEVVNNIEAKLYNAFEHEISSLALGEMVMERLRELDEVAYVRFASVYKRFEDVQTFVREINQLKRSR